MTATLRSTMPLTAWLPLQNAASAFREECSSLEQLSQELFAGLDRLGAELVAKADELEEGRRHLAERGRQLAEQRKESARLSHQLEQQETQLNETLAELRDLRTELANRPEQAPMPDLGPELESLRKQATELQVERAVLLERLEAAASQVKSGEGSSGQVSVLSADSLQCLTEQFAQQFAGLKQQLEASQTGLSTTAELEALKQNLLEQHESQLTSALAELRELRVELTTRAETPAAENLESTGLRQQVSELQVERAVLLERLEAAKHASPGDNSSLSVEALESLTDQFAQQFVALQEQVQALQQEPPEIAELDALRKERLELEAELDLVRSRSAALQETVAQQKRELASQRKEVSDELKELRDLIAEQTLILADREPALSAEPVASEQSRPERHSSPLAELDETPSKPLDPVVNSVMAQFARLQKDIAQRRKKK